VLLTGVRRGAIAAAALAALVGCSGGPAPACEVPPIPPGPPGGADAADVVLVAQGDGGQLEDLVDGAAVPLIAAPQGGHILLIGARVRGVSGCSVQINAALRDPCNNRVVGLEDRPITLQDRGDGWAVPIDPGELANYANVAVCPVQAAAHDLHGNLFELEVRISDDAGTVLAERTAMIRPTCGPDDTYCRCDCDLDGDAACDVDVDAAPGCGGAVDAAPPDA